MCQKFINNPNGVNRVVLGSSCIPFARELSEVVQLLWLFDLPIPVKI
ncbi:hypothetical protein CIPAW_16G047300 [Carya illinoinensis]|uniref:Uncharacterized protein n=1 Tax=Carya illinoinensis TaxID=32201 RepID=A0A8T1N6Q5_CARIL|nr:hypothetical protein CIPAW_16G047300 [Carya illinoinensis]